MAWKRLYYTESNWINVTQCIFWFEYFWNTNLSSLDSNSSFFSARSSCLTKFLFMEYWYVNDTTMSHMYFYVFCFTKLIFKFSSCVLFYFVSYRVSFLDASNIVWQSSISTVLDFIQLTILKRTLSILCSTEAKFSGMKWFIMLSANWCFCWCHWVPNRIVQMTKVLSVLNLVAIWTSYWWINYHMFYNFIIESFTSRYNKDYALQENTKKLWACHCENDIAPEEDVNIDDCHFLF